MPHNCTIIGFGKVGKTLSLLFKESPAHCLFSRIISRTLPAEHSLNQIEILTVEHLKTIQGVTALTVPDNAIGTLSEKLSTQCSIVPGSIIFHCSGVHTSHELAAVKAKGAFTASIHPALSFGDPVESSKYFKGTVCTYEGDQEALAILLPMFESLGAKLIPIDPQQKAKYHAACCIASNYLVGLYALSENIVASTGLSSESIPSILLPLMHSALNNLAQKSPIDALSGPIARNDVSTINLHTENLSGEYLSYYKYLGNLLIHQTGLKDRAEILKILLEKD